MDAQLSDIVQRLELAERYMAGRLRNGRATVEVDAAAWSRLAAEAATAIRRLARQAAA